MLSITIGVVKEDETTNEKGKTLKYSACGADSVTPKLLLRNEPSNFLFNFYLFVKDGTRKIASVVHSRVVTLIHLKI